MYQVLHNLVTPNVVPTGQISKSFHLHDCHYLLRNVNKAALVAA